MLKQRVLTALILAPLVIWGIFALPTSWFGALLGIFVVVGAWEWSRLAGYSHIASRAAFAALVASLLAVFSQVADMRLWHMVIFVACLWWLYAIFAVVRFDGNLDKKRHLARLAVGLVLLIPAWLALVALHGSATGSLTVLFLMLLIWGADSGAYFVGRAFGKHKLAPLVSPGKSWEGVAGAMALAVLLSLGGGVYLWEFQGAKLLFFVAVSLLTVTLSIIGDLYESMAKRRVAIKDSGKILPGHGGVLDRIDSLTSAAPVFLAGLTWVQA